MHSPPARGCTHHTTLSHFLFSPATAFSRRLQCRPSLLLTQHARISPPSPWVFHTYVAVLHTGLFAFYLHLLSAHTVGPFTHTAHMGLHTHSSLVLICLTHTHFATFTHHHHIAHILDTHTAFTHTAFSHMHPQFSFSPTLHTHTHTTHHTPLHGTLLHTHVGPGTGLGALTPHASTHGGCHWIMGLVGLFPTPQPHPTPHWPSSHPPTFGDHSLAHTYTHTHLSSLHTLHILYTHTFAWADSTHTCSEHTTCTHGTCPSLPLRHTHRRTHWAPPSLVVPQDRTTHTHLPLPHPPFLCTQDTTPGCLCLYLSWLHTPHTHTHTHDFTLGHLHTRSTPHLHTHFVNTHTHILRFILNTTIWDLLCNIAR